MKPRTIIIAAALTLATAAAAYAYTQPTVGEFGFDFYNILVNKILKGPLGFIVAVVIIPFYGLKMFVYGSAHTFWFPLFTFIAAGALLNADKIIISLGAVI